MPWTPRATSASTCASRDLDSGEIVDDAVTGIGYGCAFSLDARQVFYLRVDEAWRPHQVWRHEVGTPAERDVLVYEEADPRFWMGVGVSRDDRWIMLGIGSKTSSEIRLLDAADPRASSASWRPAARGWSTTSSRPATGS